MADFVADFGAPTDGVSDATPALNLASAVAGYVAMSVPPGQYQFLTAPNPIGNGLRILGGGISGTVWNKAFSGGNFLRFTESSNRNGAAVKDLSLYAAPGFTPGNAIVLLGDATHQPDYTTLENVNVTGPGLWNICLYVDGILRTAPQGVRDSVARNLRLFNATNATVWLRNVVGFTMEASGIFPGAGPAGACGIWVTGGGAASTNSTNVDFAAVTNNGTLNLTNLSGLSYIGGEIGSLSTDSSAHCRIETRCSGPVANNLTSSVVSLT